VWLASRKSAVTRQAYAGNVRLFMRAIGITAREEFRQVDHKAVIGWERHMREVQQLHPTTIRRRLAALSSLFRGASTHPRPQRLVAPLAAEAQPRATPSRAYRVSRLVRCRLKSRLGHVSSTGWFHVLRIDGEVIFSEGEQSLTPLLSSGEQKPCAAIE